MSNDIFLKELNFFQKNPKRTDKLDNGIGWSIGAFLIGFYIILLSVIGGKKFLEYGTLLTIIFVLVSLSIVAITIYIEKMNEPFKTFSRMVYTGNPTDLFGDLSTPNMAEHLDEIKQDLKIYSGICGDTAYYIWLRSNDPRRYTERKQREEAHKIITDIEKIQNNT